MSASSYRSASERRRGTSIALTVLAHLLILVLLLTITPSIREKLEEPPLSTFTVAPEAGTVPTQRAATKAKTKSGQAASKAPAPPLPPPVPVKLPKPARDLMHMTADEFAATDISKLAKSGAGSGDTGADSGDSVAAYGPGEGPGGQRLYNAEWYREPTSAELAGYMPPAPPGSWAVIACKTMPAYHVDNCRALDESPPGSGLSKGLRRAAWQFLVRPPRIGGKPVIGAWVRILLTFTERGVETKR